MIVTDRDFGLLSSSVDPVKRDWSLSTRGSLHDSLVCKKN